MGSENLNEFIARNEKEATPERRTQMHATRDRMKATHDKAFPVAKTSDEGHSPWSNVIGIVYTVESLAKALKISKEAVEAKAQAGELIALRTSDGYLVFPKFQFDETLKISPELIQVWRTLSSVKADEWTLATWLMAPQYAMSRTARKLNAVDYLNQGGDIQDVLLSADQTRARWSR
jgi:hypothetical protein